MDFLSAWWAAMPIFEKILWSFAVPSSILALVQVFLEVIGMGDHHGDIADGGFDADIDTDLDTHSGSGLHLFSVKGMIIFFAAFGWLGIAASRASLPIWVAVVISSAVGFVCMFIFAWLFATLSRLGEKGNYSIKNAYAKTGKVYLKIPAERAAAGKVTMVVQGTSREIMAMTDGEEIPTGTRVQVVDIIDDQTVLVVED